MEEVTNQQQDDNIWKVALTFICAAILGYGFFYSKNSTSDLAFLSGYSFPSALLIWGGFHAAVARKRGVKIVGFSFIAIYISMIASGLIGYSQQKQEAKQALSEIKSQYSKLIESSTDAQGLPKRIEKRINTAPESSGEFGEMERYMKEFMNQMVSQRNDYLLELEAIGWNWILDANRIKADKTFVESMVTIQKAKEVVAKYTKNTQTLLERAKDNIRFLNVSASSKRSMLSGFDHGMEKANKNIDALWSLEAKVIKEVENIITLLSANKGAWVVEGDQILFYNDGDLARFNSYFDSIQNIVKQQEAIQLQSVQTVNRSFDRINEKK